MNMITVTRHKVNVWNSLLPRRYIEIEAYDIYAHVLTDLFITNVETEL